MAYEIICLKRNVCTCRMKFYLSLVIYFAVLTFVVGED